MQSKIVLGAVLAAVIAAGAAAFSLTRRSRVEVPPVAPAPPRVDEV